MSIASRITLIVGGEVARAVGPRRALLLSSTTLLVGIGLVGLRPADPNDTALIDLGMVITLISLLLLIAGIHTYGRLGPDDGEKAGRAS